MDLSAIIDEFNRRKAQAGQRISDMFTPPQKPANWFQQMQQGQNAVINPQQRDNINRELADMVERFTAGMVPEPIRARDRAMQTDPSAAAKPFTSEEVKGITPFVTAAAPIAYHGTPHTFDKFDASKIGTGQGAQSYGHGLYFAENPEVAKSYVQEFSQGNPILTVRDKANKVIAQGDSISDEIMNQITQAEVKLRPQVGVSGKYGLAKGPINVGDLKVAYEKPVGQMYQVNIPDEHAARMLDWDKPLSEQAPEVQKAVTAALEPLGLSPRGTGETIYRAITDATQLASELGTDKKAASKYLQSFGIPGIKYLDQGSRVEGLQRNAYIRMGLSNKEADAFLKSRGEGTRNFVVFDPAILQDVTRK